MASLNLDHIKPLQVQLEQHPIYDALARIEDLRVFMSHHVFAVWDFMSLVKYLQARVAPVETPWMPRGDASLRYFLDRLALEEEADKRVLPDGRVEYASHFELYCRAMEEIGADVERPRRFLDLVSEQGVDAALYSPLVPLPSRYFTETTFCFIREDKPHLVAAALALGREAPIPTMFGRFLERARVTEDQAPSFHYYLARHVDLDGGTHGPLAMKLLETLCGDDPKRIDEAETAAEEAICARIRFWDGILEAIEAARAG